MIQQRLMDRLREANPVPTVAQAAGADELFARIVAGPGDSRLGDELRRAFAADQQADAHRTQAHPRTRRRGPWFAARRGRWLAAAAATIIAVPGIAYAAGVFTSPQNVARSLPAGARIFGSTPTCTVVQPNVEYRCTLAKAPSPDPVTRLTAQQWRKLLARPPHLGKIKIVNRRTEITPGHWRILQFAEITPRQDRIYRAYKNKTLASFGFTPAQIQADNEAVDAGAAGIGAGQFKGTVEPTVDSTRHINGGCRAINADGTRWNCYLGQAAVKQKVVTGLGTYVASPGVG
jgi:hypothetical protein